MAGLDLYGVDAYTIQPEYQLKNQYFLIFEDNLSLDLHIRSMTLPIPAISWNTTSFGRSYPEGFEPKNEMSITFRENVRFSNFNFFLSWLQDIFDFDNKVYKRDFMLQSKSASIVFVRRPSLGSSDAGQIAESALIQPTKIFNIRHLLPASISDLTLDDESGDPLEFTVNMVFDNMASPFVGKMALQALGII